MWPTPILVQSHRQRNSPQVVPATVPRMPHMRITEVLWLLFKVGQTDGHPDGIGHWTIPVLVMHMVEGSMIALLLGLIGRMMGRMPFVIKI